MKNTGLIILWFLLFASGGLRGQVVVNERFTRDNTLQPGLTGPVRCGAVAPNGQLYFGYRFNPDFVRYDRYNWFYGVAGPLFAPGGISGIDFDGDGVAFMACNGAGSPGAGGFIRFAPGQAPVANPLPGSFNNELTSVAFYHGDAKLWFGSMNGLVSFDPQTQQWAAFAPTQYAQVSPWVQDVAAGAFGTLWVATETGLSFFDGATWNNVTAELPNANVRDIFFDGENLEMWFATAGGIAVYNFSLDTWTDYSAAMGDFPANADNFTAVAVGPDGTAWASGLNGTLWSLNGLWAPANNATVPPAKSLLPKENYLYLVGNDFGVYKYSPLVGSVQLTEANTQYPGLPSNHVVKAAQAPDGAMWFALQDSGVAHFNGTNWTVYNSLNVPVWDSPGEGSLSYPINDILIEADGTVWVASFGGGLYRFDGAEWTVFDAFTEPGFFNDVGQLAQDASGRIWCTFLIDGTVAFYNPTAEIWDFENMESLTGNPLIHDLAATPDGTVWVACDGGLVVITPQEIMLWDNAAFPNLGPSNLFVGLTVDADGAVWVCSQQALARYDANQQWQGPFLYSDFGLVSFLPAIASLTANQQGIWLGDGAETLLHYDGQRWMVYDVYNCEPSNYAPLRVAYDYDGKRWVTTMQGGVFKQFLAPAPPQYTFVAGGAESDRAAALHVDLFGNIIEVGNFEGTMDFGDGWTVQSQGQTDIYVVKRNAAGVVEWATNIGGGGIDRAYDVTTAANGAVFVAGSYEGAVDFAQTVNISFGGGSDGAVFMLRSDGGPIRARTVGSPGEDKVVSVTPILGGGYALMAEVAPGFQFEGVPYDVTNDRDVFVALIDRTENVVNAFTFEGSDAGAKIRFNPREERIYAVGTFDTVFSFAGQSTTSQGGDDAFIAALTKEGGPIRARTVGSPGEDRVTDVDFNPVNGNVYVVGELRGVAEFAGETLPHFGLNDVFVAGFDAELGPIRARTVGSPGEDKAGGVSAWANAVYFSGWTAEALRAGAAVYENAGPATGFVARMTGAGGPIRARTVGSPGEDRIVDVEHSPFGLFVSGDFDAPVAACLLTGAPVGSFDVFLRKFDFMACPETGECALETSVDVPNGAVCAGQAASVSALPLVPGFWEYQWLPPHAFNAPTSPNPLLTPAPTGSYTLKIHDGADCAAEYVFSLNVNFQPLSDVYTSDFGHTFCTTGENFVVRPEALNPTLSLFVNVDSAPVQVYSQAGYNHYYSFPSWDFSDSLWIRVEYDYEGCRYVYENKEGADICASRTENLDHAAFVYPQPARETIYFRTPAPLAPVSTLTIFELSGKTAAELLVENGAARLPGLSPGWYLWRLVSGERVMNGKLAVE